MDRRADVELGRCDVTQAQGSPRRCRGSGGRAQARGSNGRGDPSMSVFDLPRLHFAGTATTKLPTGPRNGLVDLTTHSVVRDGERFPAGRPAAEYHAYLDRVGGK